MPLGSDSALQTMAAQQRYAKAKKQIEEQMDLLTKILSMGNNARVETQAEYSMPAAPSSSNIEPQAEDSMPAAPSSSNIEPEEEDKAVWQTRKIRDHN